MNLDEIFASAVSAGRRRLKKSAPATSISAFIGGVYVTFGGLIAFAVAAVLTLASGSHPLGWFVGSLFYPIGFVFVVLGKSELVTENFLLPVLAVWEREGSHRDIVKLWSFGFLFNIVGVITIVLIIWWTGLISSNSVMGDEIVAEFVHTTESVLTRGVWTMVSKAVYAGLFINFMSWLIVACRSVGTQLIVVWITTFPIMLLETHHCIVGSSELLLGLLYGADPTIGDWMWGYLLPVAIGNHIGGVIFVAVLHYLQVTIHRRG